VGWMHRLVLGRAGVNTSVARNGHMKREDPDKIRRALTDVQKAPIFWDNNCSLTTAEMRARLQLLVRREGIRCAIFDHLGQLKPSSSHALKDERLGIKEVMETLHFFRRELGLLVILLVQLAKDADKKPGGHPPQLSDLRGASEIEEYATQVGMIHRPVMYRPWHRFNEERQAEWEQATKPFRDSEPDNWTDWRTNPEFARKDYEEHALLAIRKNRHGATPDNICLRFRGEFQRFTNRTGRLYTNNPDYRQVELPGW
jgi:replicative DNA helicase